MATTLGPSVQKKTLLTDKFIRGLKPAPAGKRITIWDAAVPGFGVRISDRANEAGKAASAVFVVMRRLPGASTPTRHTIGRYHPDALPLAKAREAAREALCQIAGGTRPAEERKRKAETAKQRAQEEQERRANSFGAIAELFIKQHISRLRTAGAVEALIRRELIPILGEKPIGAIWRREIITLLEFIVARGAAPHPGYRRLKSGGEHAARHALAALRKLFNWALARDVEGLDANPCGRIKVVDLLGAPKARDRVLTDTELRIVWAAADITPYPFGPLVKALILTGQRLSEIAEAQWTEIEGDTLAVPAERMKGKTAHTVPLTSPTMELLHELPRFVGGNYIFTTTNGARPVSGFSKMKARLDRTIAKIIRLDRDLFIAAGLSEKEVAERVRDLAPFTLHDLRRTVRPASLPLASRYSSANW